MQAHEHCRPRSGHAPVLKQEDSAATRTTASVVNVCTCVHSGNATSARTPAAHRESHRDLSAPKSVYDPHGDMSGCSYPATSATAGLTRGDRGLRALVITPPPCTLTRVSIRERLQAPQHPMQGKQAGSKKEEAQQVSLSACVPATTPQSCTLSQQAWSQVKLQGVLSRESYTKSARA